MSAFKQVLRQQSWYSDTVTSCLRTPPVDGNPFSRHQPEPVSTIGTSPQTSSCAAATYMFAREATRSAPPAKALKIGAEQCRFVIKM